MKIFSFLKRCKYKICSIIKKIWWKLEYGERCIYGKNLSFRSRMTINIYNTGEILIGDNVFFNGDCSINSHNTIKVGNDCIFGENVRIYDHNHIFNTDKLIREEVYKTDKIWIGNNCWVGSNVIILKGALIGNNCVIGAGCIIDRTIPDGMIVRSNQALLIEPIRIEE